MWYDHQFLRLRDTFAKNRQTCQKCASFSRFTDLEKNTNMKEWVMGHGQCVDVRIILIEYLYIFSIQYVVLIISNNIA